MRYQYELAKYKLNLFTAAVVAILKTGALHRIIVISFYRLNEFSVKDLPPGGPSNHPDVLVATDTEYVGSTSLLQIKNY